MSGWPHRDAILPSSVTLFLFIAAANLFTILPGYEPPTGSLSTTTALAAVRVPLPSRCSASDSAGWRGYLNSYLQPTVIMLPFNIISELSRTLALAVRLFGNMMSGTMILGILLTITPLIFPVAMSALGLLTGMVQAYIFTILATVYIAAATGQPRELSPFTQGQSNATIRRFNCGLLPSSRLESTWVRGCSDLRWAKARCLVGFDIPCPAARRRADHLREPCSVGLAMIRVDGYLLLCRLDDSAVREFPFWNHVHRRCGYQVSMLIDWFTVAAQTINFLILVVVVEAISLRAGPRGHRGKRNENRWRN